MSSSSFWSQIRWRLGTSNSVANRISDLIQKQIDANADAQDVTVEDILNPIITVPSKMLMRDHLFQASMRSITVGQDTLFPIDPDLDKMRLWLNNDHGGLYLKDYSFMGNTAQLNGTEQSALVFSTDDDGISGSSIVNRLLDDQYIRVIDNPNIQIKDIAATEDGISIFVRLYVENNVNEASFDRAGVLFSKIDTEQVDYAYAAYLRDDGGLSFFVRNGLREYSISAPADTVQWSNINLPDFTESDFHAADFLTTASIVTLPTPIPYTDLCFTFKFSDARMQIIKNGSTIVSDTNTNAEGSGLVAWYRLNEGGDIGNTADAPSSYVRTAYNGVATGNNGTIGNAVWASTDPVNKPWEKYLSFDGSLDYMTVSNYAAVQNFTALTVSLWFYPRTISHQGNLCYKNTANVGSWILYHESDADVVGSIRNDAGTTQAATITDGVLVMNQWYHIVMRWSAGNSVRVNVNGGTAVNSAGTLTGTVSTGATALNFAHNGANCPDGFIHDIKVWNRDLSNAEVTALYGAGHPITTFPPWQANPPSEPPSPSPITNPFLSVYEVPLPAAQEQDLVKLHKITVTSLTERYNVGQGTQQAGSGVGEDGQYYNNDPTYNAGGTGTQEVLSSYDTMTTSAAQYMTLDSTQFGGQRILTGSDIIGKPITKIIAKIADVNSSGNAATGTMVAKIYKNSDNTVQATSSTVDVSTIADNQGGSSTSAWTNSTFTFTGNTYNMVNNDRVQLEYNVTLGGGGGGGGEILSGYNQLGAIINNSLAPGASIKSGQTFLTGANLLGEIVTKVVVKMCDSNWSVTQASGNVTCSILNAAGAQQASATVSASGLADNQAASSGGTWTNATFTFPSNTYVMAADSDIEFSYNFGGSGSSGISVATCSTVETNTNAYDRLSGGSVTDYTSRDVVMDVYVDDGADGGWEEEEGSSASSSSSPPPPPPRRSFPRGIMMAQGELLSGYSQLTTAISNFAFTSYNNFVAQIVDNTSSDLHGQVITKVVCKMCDMNWQVQGATGNVQLFIKRGSDGVTMASSNTINANTLANNQNATSGGSWTTCTFTFTGNTYPMSGTTLDYIMLNFNYNQVSGTSMAVAVACRGTSGEANTRVSQFNNSTGWDGFSGNLDAIMDVYISASVSEQQVGVARSTANPESFSNQYDALVATPTTFTDRSSNDLSMQIYINSAVSGTPNHLYTRLDLAGSKYVAIYINSTSALLYDKKISKVTARMYKVLSPTGTIFCKIKKASDGSTITFGLNGTPGAGLTVSTIGTASTPATLYSFENDDNGQATGYALQVGDRIMLELSGGSSSATDNVQLARTHTTSQIPNVHMQVSVDGTTWTTPNSGVDDVIGVVYTGGFTTPTIDPYYTLGYQNERILQKVTSITAAEGSIYNQKLTQVKVWMKRIGSPTGLITVCIRNSAGTLVSSLNTFDAASVDNATFTQYTFTNLNQTYTLALNDRVSVEYTGGDASNHIQINANLLDSYPYGVLETYSGSTYATQSLHDLAGMMYSGGGSTDPFARTRVGELVATATSAINLKKISRIKVRMKRTGAAPPGNVVFRVRNASNAIASEIGTKAAATIDPNSPVEYTITSSPIAVYALQTGDYVSIEYNDGDDFNYVEVMTTKTTDGFDGTTNTYLAKYDDINWVPNNAIDLVGQMWEGGDTFTPSQEDVTIPDPVYTKDLTVLAGGYPWTWIDHDAIVAISTASTLTHAPSQLHINAVMPDFRFYRKVLTTTELTNIYTNRLDRGTIAFSKVAKIGYFAPLET